MAEIAAITSGFGELESDLLNLVSKNRITRSEIWILKTKSHKKK
jgi:hypothetical protein